MSTALLIVVLALVVSFVWDWWCRYAHRRRCRRGHRAEHRAERLLRKRGYQLVDGQVPARFPIWVDGEEHWVSNRCDRIVRRKGMQFVVEVKTGAGVDPLRASTRRQLLEYWLCHEVDGVLIVNMDAKTIKSVVFPAAWRPSALSLDVPA